MAQLVKNPPELQETWVWSLGWDDPLEKGKSMHSSVLTWRIPWTVAHGVATSQTWMNFTFTLQFSPICHGLLSGISLTQPHNCIGQRHGHGWLKSNKAPLSLSLSLNHLCYYPLSYCLLLSSPFLHSPGEEKGPGMLKNLYSFITCISSLFLLNGFLKIAVKVTCYKAHSFNHI